MGKCGAFHFGVHGVHVVLYRRVYFRLGMSVHNKSVHYYMIII